MKYLVLIPDGSADWPDAALGEKTPLQAARTPNLDRLVEKGETGLVRTVPDGMEPGSDVANLSLFGYDPSSCYTGRAPLEAASMGVDLADDDIAFRCNLVSLGGASAAAAGTAMEDYSAGHIETDESRAIIEDFLKSEEYARRFLPDVKLYPGVGYRHLLVWRGGSESVRLTPPHDILGREVSSHLPAGDGEGRLREMMEISFAFLKNHPVNAKRRAESKRTVDSFWFWGAGRRPSMTTFNEMTGFSGAVISAVDLVNGIGVLAGLERIDVPGATGYVDTNYEGKAEHALRALERHDVVFVHIESPDEAGHQGDAALKVKAIEDIDKRFLGELLAKKPPGEGFRLLVAPDHPTPWSIKTHAADPVPFVISPVEGVAKARSFDEVAAGESGLVVEEGHLLLGRLFSER